MDYHVGVCISLTTPNILKITSKIGVRYEILFFQNVNNKKNKLYANVQNS